MESKRSKLQSEVGTARESCRGMLAVVITILNFFCSLFPLHTKHFFPAVFILYETMSLLSSEV